MELFVQGVKEEEGRPAGHVQSKHRCEKKERKCSIEDKQRQTGRKHLSARPHNVMSQKEI